MASKLFPSLAATAFAAMLFHFFSKRRSREINEGEANNSAAANDGAPRGASSTHASTEGPGMAASSGYDYEVFLSFKGPDTRSGFTDFLYTSLNDAGIRTFKDDKELSVGEVFASELIQAINQSKISIPIFSKGYASSVWCLKELAKMVACQKVGRQKIMPIFYDVAPSEVRYQTAGYKKAFLARKEKKRYDEKTIQEWMDALSVVEAISGWDLHREEKNRREGESARDITKKVFTELKKPYMVVSDNLVNVDNVVDAIKEMIGAQTSEMCIIGIYGMGGIGKTTVAKIIYNQLSENFECCCFLSNIREKSERKGIEWLQSQLISDILKNKCTDIRNIDDGIKIIKDRLSNKRVLLLLDDVHEKNHMDALVGEREWFGKGSKLIITTRNKELLDVLKVDDCYELIGMNRNQSLQLFSKHAFRRDSPLDEYIDQANKVIDIAKGLPLALEVIGSLLSHIEKKKWNNKLENLENVPHTEVQRTLKISYDALEVRHKHIFLDIACLFIGYNKDVMVHFWEKSELFPKEALEVLQNMSLIKIEEDNGVWMHDQLRDLGREIVRQESNTKIKNQSRVWDPKEGLDLLRKHKGKKEVEALRLKLDNQHQYCFTYEGFESLSDLRFLEVDSSMENFGVEERLLWHESLANVVPTNENSYLLPQLRWLSWRDIPPTFNITNFFMEDVVILNLSRSKIMDDWKGWNHIKVMKNLKVLDMSNCQGLKKTPNFSAHSILERLVLCCCQSLIEIDGSICQLKCLVSLDVENCGSLQRLPNELGGDLASLEYLSLGGCVSLERLPDSIGNLESLIELNISNTWKIKELPNSIGNLKNLKVLKMRNSHLSKIPDALWKIGKLEEIEASRRYSGQHFHGNIGNCIYGNKSLRILRLTCAHIYALPWIPESLIHLKLDDLYMDKFPDLSNLTNLKELDLKFGSCDLDGKSYGPVEDPIPWWMGNLSNLESLDLRFDCVTASPTDVSLPPQLKSLHLEGPNLRSLPKLPSSLSSLHLDACMSLCLMEDLSNLKKLSTFRIWKASISEIQGLGCLENLRDLELNRLGHVKILPDLSNLNKLSSLRVEYCDKLVEIQGKLPQSLGELKIYSCGSLRQLPGLSNLKGLQQFGIFECDNLVEIQLELLQSLKALRIHSCESLQKLSDLSSLKELQEIAISKCGNLVEIQGQLPQSLKILEIHSCGSLQHLPNQSNLKGLERFDIR